MSCSLLSYAGQLEPGVAITRNSGLGAGFSRLTVGEDNVARRARTHISTSPARRDCGISAISRGGRYRWGSREMRRRRRPGAGQGAEHGAERGGNAGRGAEPRRDSAEGCVGILPPTQPSQRPVPRPDPARIPLGGRHDQADSEPAWEPSLSPAPTFPPLFPPLPRQGMHTYRNISSRTSPLASTS